MSEQSDSIQLLSKGDGRFVGAVLMVMCLAVLVAFFSDAIKSTIGGILAILLTGIPAGYLLASNMRHRLYIRNAALHWEVNHGKHSDHGNISVNTIAKVEHSYVPRRDGQPIPQSRQFILVTIAGERLTIPQNAWSALQANVVHAALKQYNSNIEYTTIKRKHGDW